MSRLAAAGGSQSIKIPQKSDSESRNSKIEADHLKGIQEDKDRSQISQISTGRSKSQPLGLGKRVIMGGDVSKEVEEWMNEKIRI